MAVESAHEKSKGGWQRFMQTLLYLEKKRTEQKRNNDTDRCDNDAEIRENVTVIVQNESATGLFISSQI